MEHEGGADALYWQGLREGAIRLPQCKGCGAWQWPAVSRCGKCGSWEQTWIDVALDGEIYSWTRTHHVFGGLEALKVPYVVAIVSLPHAGGIRLMGRIEGDDSAVRIGAKVRAEFGVTPWMGEECLALKWRLS